MKPRWSARAKARGLGAGLGVALLLTAAGWARSRFAHEPVDVDAHLATRLEVHNAVSARRVAGVELARLAQGIAALGWTESAREVWLPEEGGVILSFSDAARNVRAVVRLAVTESADSARHFAAREALAVSAPLALLAEPGLGDEVRVPEAGGGLVIARWANLAYTVALLDARADAAAGLSGERVAAVVAAAVVWGEPRFPEVEAQLPAEFSAEQGTPLVARAEGGLVPEVSAEGAYVAEGASGALVRPFAPGPVSVRATVVDALARVAAVRAGARAY